ncbi:MAG: NADH-quinone oxidoreductase subunit H [Thermodesulfobacteriota bacterium]|nr:NADH-quinone oxidoreductase subunit H [Desulfovibrionales bacterium]MDQ7837849.1 NADH-quinone oxidoreductase subunit H [Thermodesulfobacteriota bacterium]
MNTAGYVSWFLALLLSPLLLGIINRTKAFFAGRRGAPLVQAYFDCWKLLQKGAVYSRTTTWVFVSGPVVGLAAVSAAAALVPLGSIGAPVSFAGDLILFAYLLGLMRFFTVVAALDTGSSFEGMGASREVWFSALAEPALLLGLAVLARETKSLSLSGMIFALTGEVWTRSGIILLLLAVALFIVLLAENARIPVDDPNTHLELTMIHEVMVLDHSGPDFGFILYGAALKLWVLSAILVGLVVPVRTGNPWLDGAAVLVGIMAVAVLVGIVESCMARLRLVRVPQLLVGAGAFSTLALILALR